MVAPREADRLLLGKIRETPGRGVWGMIDRFKHEVYQLL